MNVCVEDNVLEELLTLLKLEKIEENIFRGQSQDPGFGNVFGGQVLGQSLSAAYRTVPQDRKAHSLHAYFLRMDDWLLYVIKSPNACKARGLSDGRIYTREGKLVASVAQEGLIRNWAMKK